MLIRHPRIPAVSILLGATALCLLYLRSSAGSVGQADPSSLESLESAIAAGNASPQTWRAYGARLVESGRPGDAAVAYEKFLAAAPYDRDVQLACARALSAAGEGDRLYAFLKPLLYENPKMIVEFLDTSPRRSVPPFDGLYREAVNQAMD